MTSSSLMPMNGTMTPADAVDDEVAPQDAGRAGRPVLDAAQRQRDQRDDDERVEDHGAQDGRLSASGAA